MKGSSCCLGSVEESDQALLVSAAHGLELNAVLIDLECRHGLNSSGLSSASVGVDIDLHQLELRVSRHMALINGTNHSAGRAPGSCKVNDEWLATIGSCLDGRFEGSLVGKVQFSVIISHCFESLFLVFDFDYNSQSEIRLNRFSDQGKSCWIGPYEDQKK